MENKTKKCPEISEQFFNEIDKYENIYIEISGGYNSTATTLIFYEKGYKNIGLIHNNTRLQYKECLDNIQKLIKLTGYSLIFKEVNKKYKISELMKESFQNIDKAKIDILNYRSYFKCCKVLKNTRNHKWNNDFLLDNSIVISSITPYESRNRYIRLNELRNRNTFLRFHKNQNIMKGYPYRDMLIINREYSRNYFDNQFENILKKYDMNIIHSGCRICPIKILFPEMQNINDCSVKYYNIFNLKKS